MSTITLSRLNGITATIVACLNCYGERTAIAHKISSKYGISLEHAFRLIDAIVALEG